MPITAPTTPTVGRAAPPTAPPECVAVAAAWVFFDVAVMAPEPPVIVAGVPPGVGAVGMPLEHAPDKAASLRDWYIPAVVPQCLLEQLCRKTFSVIET
jgi:hypothetical protein